MHRSSSVVRIPVACWFALTGAALAMFGAGCASTKPPTTDDHSMVKTNATAALAGRSTWLDPVVVFGRRAVIAPFALEDRKGWDESADAFGDSNTAYGRPVENARVSVPAASYFTVGPSRQSNRIGVRWHNAVIRELDSKRSFTVLDRRGVISAWEPLWRNEGDGRKVMVDQLLFAATVEDTNKNGVLDDQDRRVALLCEWNGEHLRRVTPEDAHVRSWRFEGMLDVVFFELVFDQNHDGAFDFNDPPETWVLNLAEGPTAIAKPVVDRADRDRVERTLREGK